MCDVVVDGAVVAGRCGAEPDESGEPYGQQRPQTLGQICANPDETFTRWIDVEHLFIALGGFAEWTDKHHLGVKLNGHTASFRTPEDKSSRLDAADGEKLRDFLRSAGVGEDMAEGDGEHNR